MEKREQWKNRSTFIMAAIGSAVGLGNIWRFPYIAAKSGGGAFLVPYFIALLTAGIPLLIVEYGLGLRSQGSANIALGSIKKPFRFFGWFAILASFTINLYYCIIMGWTWNYLFNLGDIANWGANLSTAATQFNEVLHIDSANHGPWIFNKIHLNLLIGLLLTWLTIWTIIKKGLHNVGKALLFTVPLPIILMLILLVRGLTLDGAMEGLNYFLSPDWSQLRNPMVWINAYGQIFYSLTIGFGAMIAYASFMPRKTEVPNSASITAFANCSFSFMAGFAVFSVLGFFAMATNTPIDKVTTAGPEMAFVVYPTALATLPVLVKFFAALFFLSLLLLGTASAFSLLQTVSAAISDKFDMSRSKATTIVAIISIIMTLPFTTSAGLYWLDLVDHFVMNYVLTIGAIAEALIVGWVVGTKKFKKEINRYAEIKLGKLFSFLIKFLIPIMLSVIVILSLIQEFKNPYSGYPISAILIIGVGSVLFITVTALLLSNFKNDVEERREQHAREIATKIDSEVNE